MFLLFFLFFLIQSKGGSDDIKELIRVKIEPKLDIEHYFVLKLVVCRKGFDYKSYLNEKLNENISRELMVMFHFGAVFFYDYYLSYFKNPRFDIYLKVKNGEDIFSVHKLVCDDKESYDAERGILYLCTLYRHNI